MRAQLVDRVAARCEIFACVYNKFPNFRYRTSSFKIYNQGTDQEKIDMSSEIAPTTLPGYPALQRQPSEGGGFYPPPQPSEGGFYPPPQPSEGGFYLLPGACPSFPVQQQPTSTMHNTSTTVVIQQQPAAVIVQGPRDWSTGIEDCFDDCEVCKSGGRGTGQRGEMSTNSELSKYQTKLGHSRSVTSVLPSPSENSPGPPPILQPFPRYVFSSNAEVN